MAPIGPVPLVWEGTPREFHSTRRQKCPSLPVGADLCPKIHGLTWENVIGRGASRRRLVVCLETRASPQPSATEPREALRRAVKSLEDGPADPRTVEGAKVNALESIAWSLIGLLGDRLHHQHERPEPRVHAAPPGALTTELRSILGLEEPAR